MTKRVEYVGRYRRAGNTKALFVPLELRQELQNTYGWVEGDYLMVVPQGGLLMIRKLDKSMIAPPKIDQRSREA